jgi:hypothetical protein
MTHTKNKDKKSPSLALARREPKPIIELLPLRCEQETGDQIYRQNNRYLY